MLELHEAWGAFVQLCVHVLWDMYLWTVASMPIPWRRIEVPRNTSPVSGKSPSRDLERMCTPSFHIPFTVVLDRSYGIDLQWSVWRTGTIELALFFEACCQMPAKKSLGIGKLTMGFYCDFWDVWAPDSAAVWTSSPPLMEEGIL